MTNTTPPIKQGSDEKLSIGVVKTLIGFSLLLGVAIGVWLASTVLVITIKIVEATL